MRETRDPTSENISEAAVTPADPRNSRDVAAGHLEVEFALVLARTIDSIKSDPAQLRGAVYELARQKLREQFTREDASQIGRMTAALEVAIEGVEAHSKKEVERQVIGFLGTPAAPRALSDRHYPAAVRILEPPGQEAFATEPEAGLPPSLSTDDRFSRSRRGFSAAWRFLLVMCALLAVVGFVLQRSGKFARLRGGEAVDVAQDVSIPPKVDPAPRAAAPEPPKVVPLLPTNFGIYAVSDEKLYELDPLQGSAPDIRVAISAAITTSSRTVLPSGTVRFIVYRRDTGGVPSLADVRVVAKVEQATTFDPSGKPVISKADENWVIRNISYPYRTAPIKDNVEMYEVQSKDNAELSPGRYALVIKDIAYDFSVAGKITDSRQCLERLAASNGTFYSQCPKLP